MTIVLAVLAFGLTALAVTTKVASFGDAKENGNSPDAVAAVPDKRTASDAPKKAATKNKNEVGDAAPQTPAPVNGEIVFARGDGGGGNRIYKTDLNAPDSDIELTALADTQPAWSADGTKIVFVTERNGEIGARNSREIYTMNADGSEQRQLNFYHYADSQPAWSPDGAKIVFAELDSDGGSHISIMNADGSNQTSLTYGGSGNYFQFPSFSPTGAKILFTRGGSLWTMNPDGSNQTLLLDGSYSIGKASYSPDGAKIVFTKFVDSRSGPNGAGKNSDLKPDRTAPPPRGQIYVADADGSNALLVSSALDRNDDDNPAWSPDGTKIVFTGVHGSYPNPITRGLYVVNADGTNETLRRAAPENENFYSPSWRAACGEASAPACPPTKPLTLRMGLPHPVEAGRDSEGIVTLAAAAPAGGAQVDLSVIQKRVADRPDPRVSKPDGQADSPVAEQPDGSNVFSIPPSVTVPEGATTARFPITTSASSYFDTEDIIATRGDATAQMTVSIAPVSIDFEAANFVAPAAADVFTDFNVSWTDKNVGAGAVDRNWYDCVYISPDPLMFNGNDRQISCENNAPPLAGGQSRDFSATVKIPYSAIPADGDYYLIILVNADKNVNERLFFNERNYIARPIHVRRTLSDYVAQNVAAPAEIEPDSRFDVSWTTRNVGNRDVAADAINDSRNDVYFSLDNIAGNADDLYLGSTTTPRLAAGEARDSTISANVGTLPVRPSGDAFIYVRVDANNAIYEGANTDAGETNNTTFRATKFNYRVADLQVQSVGAPTEAETETPFALNWTTRNAGNKNAAAFNERVYFSPDNQIGDDLEIGSFPLEQGIIAGQSINRIQNITIPTSAITATGDYFVYVKTDSDNNVDEGENEANNVRFQPVHVRRFLRPDLQVTNITAPNTAFFDQTISIQWTVTNNGPGATNSSQWYDTVYLSTTQNAGGASIYATNINYLNAGESYIASADFHVPRGSSGSYFVVVKTDSNNQVAEESEDNNILSRPITINVPPLPDLRVSNVQAPEEAFAGQQFPVGWTVGNAGTGGTVYQNYWSDQVWISQTATLDFSKARRLEKRAHAGALDPGANYQVNGFNALLPSDIAGDWYVFVVTDIYDEVYEFTAENNNFDYDRAQPGSPMHVRVSPPDLIVQNPFNAPATANTNQTVSVAFTVKNQGAFDAVNGWYEGVYLSNDQTLSDDDTLLGVSPLHQTLAAGAQYTAAFDVRIPSCVSGSFYLIAKTDFNNRVFEFDPNFNAEANNTSQPKAIQISNSPADLTVSNVSAPPTAIGGQSLQINWTTANAGTGATAASGWTDDVYLGASPNALQYRVGSFQHQGALAAGANYSQSQAVVVPSALQGNYFITVRTDAYNQVDECGAKDNNLNGGTVVNIQNSLPDLRVTAISAPASATLGAPIAVQWTARNFGQPMTRDQSWFDRVYISNDNTFDGGDTFIGSVLQTANLASGASYTANARVTIPNHPTGNYYLLVVADADNNVVEGLPDSAPENNNSFAAPLTLVAPGIDLQASNVSAAAPTYSGVPNTISWRVTNAGDSPTLVADWTDYVILSRDSVYDQTDSRICYKQHFGALAGGASYDATMPCVIPAGLTGDYNIFVITDRNNAVIETNDGNNISPPLAVNLQLPPPSDLNITHITPPANAAPGEDATFTWTVQNSGANAATGEWIDTVYLSTDATWDVGDAIVGQKLQSGTINPATTYTSSLTAPVPAVDTGNYYVIVRTDARNNVRESNESNNVSASVSTTSVAVTTLTLGTPYDTTLFTNQEKFFKYDTPANETLLVTLLGVKGTGNELFTRFGSMVNRSNYEVQSTRQREANQENVVSNTRAGTYYTEARGDYVPGSFAPNLRQPEKSENPSAPNAGQNITVKAELLPFAVRRVSPTVAGNKGFATLLVEGAKFQTGATVKLVGANNAPITPTATEVGITKIAAIFDLNGKAAGVYTIVVTNPNNQTATLADGFQIVNDGGYSLRTSIIGPNDSRGGSSTRFVFTASNDGLNDALNVPILIQMPSDFAYTLDRVNFIEFPTADLPPDAIPAQIPLDGEQNGVRTIMLFAPILRANSTIKVGIDIAIPRPFSAFEVTARVLPPLAELASVFEPNTPAGNASREVYGPTLAPTADNTQRNCWTEVFRQAIFTLLGELLPGHCLAAGWNVLLTSADLVTGLSLKAATGNQISNFDSVGALASKFVSVVGKLAIECGGYAIPWFRAASVAVAIFQIAAQMYDCLTNLKSQLTVSPRRSSDPNEMIGPAGYGAERFVGVQQPLLYRINFENVASANAPAQRIRIVDQLPATFDARTARLVEIGFKQNRYVVPDNRAFYQNRVQLGADLNDLKADVSAGLDLVNNRVTWTLTAIDPATNEQPLNPLVGLLPPNNANHDGEGYVTFTVMPFANQPTRTNLANSATIYFDDNEPIPTDTATNLLDADIPTSSLAALPATQSSPSFNLNWSGADAANGSGFKTFDVFVSENGGVYEPLLTETTQTSVQFNGKYGKNYRFYTLARDNAGNLESPPDAPDAVTSVADSSSAISGNIIYGIGDAQNLKYVPNVTLTAAGNSQTTANSNASGAYRLSGLGSGAYTVTPSKTGDINSISGFDASLVARRSANLITLTANQMIAADVSGNGTVSALDASLIARTAANVPNAGIAGQWIFAPVSRSYSGLVSDLAGENYEAILMGEVSGNWTPTTTTAQPGSRRLNENAASSDKKEESGYRFIPIVPNQSNAESAFPKATDAPQATISVALPANSSSSKGTTVLIPITVGDTTGADIFSYDFTVTFDPNVLQPADAAFDTTGTISGAAGFSITPNTGTAGQITVSAFGTQPLSGSGTLLNLRFNVVGTAAATTGATALTFRSFVFNEGNPAARTTDGNFIVAGPTASMVFVRGRAVTALGRGIKNVFITMSDSHGNMKRAVTTGFGYYQFRDIAAGETYVISAKGKHLIFSQPSRVLNINEDTNNVNFIANP